MACLSDKAGEERGRMKNDLISRKAIKGYINQSDLTNREKMTLHIAISNIPTTAAVPEVHGRWVKGTSCDLHWNCCSVCGGKILKNEYQQDYFSDYCLKYSQ